MITGEKRKIKLCIVCSAGGHLAEAIRATEGINHDKYYVTYYTPHIEDFAKNHKVYFITHPRHCNVVLRTYLFLRNCIDSIRLLRIEQPDVIISTGADVAVATCILGKILGKKLIYIESGGYVFSRSVSGRIVYRFADLFIVQWEPALKNYSKAIYGGPLF